MVLKIHGSVYLEELDMDIDFEKEIPTFYLLLIEVNFHLGQRI